MYPPFFVSHETDVALDMDWSEFPPKSERDCATPERLTSFYDKQKAVPGYRRILQKNITVFGTFDGACGASKTELPIGCAD